MLPVAVCFDLLVENVRHGSVGGNVKIKDVFQIDNA